MPITDGADRLAIASLERLRDLHDRHVSSLILMGMTALEETLVRYPKLGSRIGFVHAFRSLSGAEMRTVACRHAAIFGAGSDPGTLEGLEERAAVIRTTRGNLRFADRLLARTRRIVDLDGLRTVTTDTGDAARHRLVIGRGD